MSRAIVERRAQLARALRIVPYLTCDEVRALAQEAKKRRKGERDSLLILVLFQTGLRISEALSLTPSHIESFEGRPVLRIVGKGGKPRVVALPENLADKMRAYAYEKGIKINERFFQQAKSLADTKGGILQGRNYQKGLPPSFKALRCY